MYMRSSKIVVVTPSKQIKTTRTSLAMFASFNDASDVRVTALREVTSKVTSLSALFFRFIFVNLDVRAANIGPGGGIRMANIG